MDIQVRQLKPDYIKTKGDAQNILYKGHRHKSWKGVLRTQHILCLPETFERNA